MEALVLGGAAAGKTLLVRQLSRLAQARADSARAKTKRKRARADARARASDAPDALLATTTTKSTVGVELDGIVLGKGSGGGADFTLREVGAPMAPMWPAFFSGCAAVVFVVDASDGAGICDAAVELWSAFENTKLAGKPLLMVLSKIDAPALLSAERTEALLRLDDIRAIRGVGNEDAVVDVIRCNLLDKRDCEPVLEWLESRLCR